KVYTLHGFAADFARTLRDLGFDAHSLSQDEQLALPIIEHPDASRFEVASPKSAGRRPTAEVTNPVSKVQAPKSKEQDPKSIRDTRVGTSSAPPFLAFALTCAQIASNQGKLEKVRLLAEYLRGLRGDVVAL